MIKLNKPCCMLISVPRSGSSWLFRSLRTGLRPEFFAHTEFFNPYLNQKYKDALIPFGGHDVLTSIRRFPEDYIPSLDARKNIARPASFKNLENAFNNSWRLENYHFTKEVWSVYSIPFYKKHFHCVGLIKKASETFPGTHPEMNRASFLIMYESLIHNFIYQPEDIQDMILSLMKSKTEQEIMVGTHAIYNSYLLRQGIPILEYEKIMTLPTNDLTSYLTVFPSNIFDLDKVAVEIVKTRVVGKVK